MAYTNIAEKYPSVHNDFQLYVHLPPNSRITLMILLMTHCLNLLMLFAFVVSLVISKNQKLWKKGRL